MPVIGHGVGHVRCSGDTVPFILFRQHLVQFTALRKQHHVVDHFQQQFAAKAVSQLSVCCSATPAPHAFGQQRVIEYLAMALDGGLITVHRMDRAQRGALEMGADHACHFDGQLLIWREPVDARGDEAFNGVGQFYGGEVAAATPHCHVAVDL